MKRFLAAVTLTACTTPVGLTESEIIGGTRSEGASATVLLASYPPDRSTLFTCTAVVIAPTVLLTAAHCVDVPNHRDHIFGVFLEDDASPYPTLVDLEPMLVPVASTHAHPQYSTQPPFFADIGVVVLAESVAVTPVPLHVGPVDSTIGKPALIVGYGQTVFEQPNQARFEAMTVVDRLEDDTVVVGDSQHRACLGDSGGPAIVEGKLIGVDSFGLAGCTDPANYRRVDSHMGFIQPFLAVEPEPDPMDPVDPAPESGGCSTTGGAGLGVALVALAARRRRRR
jgi:MYXO-CTERM domain-containing protein